ncbi:MAG: hypothetical protein LPK80_10120 [Bacteroidota bacterium]|nr:hypothetical protein [Bacteroidota bacterium]
MSMWNKIGTFLLILALQLAGSGFVWQQITCEMKAQDDCSMEMECCSSEQMNEDCCGLETVVVPASLDPMIHSVNEDMDLVVQSPLIDDPCIWNGPESIPSSPLILKVKDPPSYFSRNILFQQFRL